MLSNIIENERGDNYYTQCKADAHTFKPHGFKFSYKHI